MIRKWGTNTRISIRRFVVYVLAIVIVISLSACNATSGHKKTAGGAVLGAVAGALLGAVVGGEDGAAIGALIGGVVGGAIGAKLDAEDQNKRQVAYDSVANQPRGGVTQWSSPEKGTDGQLVKVSNVYQVDGKRCMEVEETITINGKPQIAKDMQCEDQTGTWVAANF